MKLYVIRHADAEALGGNQRPLSAKGREQSLAIGHYFRALRAKPSIVLCSPVLRAKQTAEILSELAALGKPSVESWLRCGMAPEIARRELSAYSELESVAIIGHEPDLSYFLATTLGDFPYAVKKASVAVVEHYLERVDSPQLGEQLRF